MHVDRPERHSQLSGGHDHDIFHLSWGPSQMGTILLSADSRNCLCLWKPVQGLINRWQLHHRLVLPAVALVQWLSQGPIYSLPEPHFPGKPIPAPPAPSNQQKASYEARYRRDMTPRRPDPNNPNPNPAGGKASDLVFRSPSGCLCIFALTRYGEARVFLELSAGTSGMEWGSASARLCTHELPDAKSSSRAAASSAQSSESNTSNAVLFLQASTSVVRDNTLMVAVADESQVIVFQVRCRFHPLRVTVTPHTRSQLKSEIRLFPCAKQAWRPPRLQQLCLDPNKSDMMLLIYSVGGPNSEQVLRLERLKMTQRKQEVKAGTAPSTETTPETIMWVWQRDVIIDLPTSAPDVCVTSLIVTADAQYVVLGYSDGAVEARHQDTLQPADGNRHYTPVDGGAVVGGCSSPLGNCALLMDSAGRASVVEFAHLWALDPAATPGTIAAHLVHQLEVVMAKLSEAWEVLLALGGILAAHPLSLSIFDALTKQLRDNNKQMGDLHRRFYRHVYETLTVKIHAMSADHQFLCTSSEARLLLFYLLDCFRFALPVMPRVDPNTSRTVQPSLSSAAGSKLKALCSEMMLTMGESIVGLTVWNLKQATTNIKFEKQRQAQQTAGGDGAGVAARTPFGKNFLLDPEALTFTRDLLSYYLKKVRDNQPKEDPAAMTPAEGVAPPPPPPTTDAPVTETDKPLSEIKGKELPYTADDIKFLIEIVEAVINAHKAPRASGQPAEGGAPQGVQEKQRMFKEVLSKHQVDPEIGLPEKLKARFSDPKFDQQALANYLSLSMPQLGFLARACGFFNMQLADVPAEASKREHEPLPRKRTFDQYARDELMAGKGEDAVERKWREFDVLTRLRLTEVPTRECNACGRLTTASEGVYNRWLHACPMSGGRWRVPLEWEWEAEEESSQEPAFQFLSAPPP